METRIKFSRVVAGALLLAIMQSHAVAQTEEDKGKAKEHFFKAKELVEEGAWKKAIMEFEASYDLNPVPMVLFNMAVCYDKLTEYARASNFYRRFLAEGKDASQEMKDEADTRIKELGKFLGLVKLNVSGIMEGEAAGAEVIVDGNLIGKTPLGVFFLETGEHEILLRKEGYFDSKKKFKVISGETTSLKMNLKKQATKVVEGKQLPAKLTEQKPHFEKKVEEEKPTAPPVEARKEKNKLGTGPFWAGLGLTLAFGATAIVTGALALQKDKEVAGMKDNEDWQDLRAESDNLALTTDVLIGLGGASAITTLVLVFFTDFKKGKKDESKLSFSLSAAPSCPMLGIGGKFR